MRKNTTLKKNLAILFLVLNLICYSQTASFSWAKQFGGPSSNHGRSIAVDASGNVYSMGTFAGTVDFDPGAGTFNLTSLGGTDIFVSKLDASGNFIWAKQLGGAGSEISQSIAIDNAGNVFTTGSFTGVSDFDPSSSFFNLTSFGVSDIFVSKLDASGNFVWAKNLGGALSDQGQGIAVDGSGNVYSTGYFSGNADFDPSASVVNLVALGNVDIFISKLDASGNFVWAKQLSGNSNEVGYSIALDSNGDVFTTGYYSGTVDFDPSASAFSMVSAGTNDVFVSKLSAAGNFVWAKRLGGASSTEVGFGIALDGLGNVYTTGYFNGVADFDPGASSFTLSALGNNDGFISKLDGTGNFVWVKQFGSIVQDEGQSIAVDGIGNVYTTGFYAGTLDFDPNASVFNLTSVGAEDVFVSKLDALGNFVWAKSYGGIGADRAYSIFVDNVGSVHTTGFFNAVADFDPSAATFSLTSAGANDIIIHKMCQPPIMLGSIIGNTIICAGDIATYSVANVFGATSYSWNLPSGWSGAGLTNTILVTPSTSGTFSVNALNACGSSAMLTVSITVSPCTNINEIKIAESVLVYPNPTSDNINIEFKETSEFFQNQPIKIILTDVLGRIILSENASSKKFKFSIKDLPLGIYYLKLTQNSNFSNFSIIKN